MLQLGQAREQGLLRMDLSILGRGCHEGQRAPCVEPKVAARSELDGERRQIDALIRSALGDDRTEALFADGKTVGPDKMVAVLVTEA